VIPEHYWQILRRWYWLMAGVALATTVVAVLTLPALLGNPSDKYNGSVTLGVTRMVSFGGTTAAGSGDSVLLASYTSHIAERGATPQFRSSLAAALQERGITVTRGDLEKTVRYTTNDTLFRITIEATARVPNDARVIAETAATLLIADVAAEEDRIKDALTATSEEEEAQLLSRLDEVYEERIERLDELGDDVLRAALDDLVRSGVGADLDEAFSELVQDLARLSADPELAVLNSEASSLETQLAALSEAKRNFSTGFLQGDPVSIVTPTETVLLVPPKTLRTRDMGLMGLVVGLVLGWIAANTAESLHLSLRLKKHREEEWDPTLMGAGSIYGDD
jgi:hypothetical protein